MGDELLISLIAHIPPDVTFVGLQEIDDDHAVQGIAESLVDAARGAA